MFPQFIIFLCLLKCKSTLNFRLHLPVVTCEYLFTKITSFFIYQCLMNPTTASTHLKKIRCSCCIFQPVQTSLDSRVTSFPVQRLGSGQTSRFWELWMALFFLKGRGAVHPYRSSEQGRTVHWSCKKSRYHPGESSPLVSQFLQWVALNLVFHVSPRTVIWKHL